MIIGPPPKFHGTRDNLAEQAYLDRAHNMLDREHADAEASLAAHVPGNRATTQAMPRSLDIQLNSKGTGALIFGRADTVDDRMPAPAARL